MIRTYDDISICSHVWLYWGKFCTLTRLGMSLCMCMYNCVCQFVCMMQFVSLLISSCVRAIAYVYVRVYLCQCLCVWTVQCLYLCARVRVCECVSVTGSLYVCQSWCESVSV